MNKFSTQFFKPSPIAISDIQRQPVIHLRSHVIDIFSIEVVITYWNLQVVIYVSPCGITVIHEPLLCFVTMDI